MQLFTLGITWLSKWIISARTRIFYILIDERSEAAVNVACLPDGRTPILLFFWWADHHTVEREIFFNFPKKDQTSNQVQTCPLIRVVFVIFINYQKSFWIWKIYFSNFPIKMISRCFVVVVVSLLFQGLFFLKKKNKIQQALNQRIIFAIIDTRW